MPDEPEWCFDDYATNDSNNTIDLSICGTVYLNANGVIINGCDWSYAMQDDVDDEQEIVVCHVNNFTSEVIGLYEKSITKSA